MSSRFYAFLKLMQPIPIRRLKLPRSRPIIRPSPTAKIYRGPGSGKAHVPTAKNALYACDWRTTMACFEHGTIVELATRETVTLPDVRGGVVRVARGTVWITQEGDPHDGVLRGGDTWVVERDGSTVAEAQSDVEFSVMGRYVEPGFAASEVEGPSAWAQTRDPFAGLFTALFNTPSRGATPYFGFIPLVTVTLRAPTTAASRDAVLAAVQSAPAAS